MKKAEKIAKKAKATADVNNLLGDIPAPKTYKKGEIIEGTVLEVRDGEMIIDVKARAEGVVTGKELKLDGKKINKKAGDLILVYVMNPENEEGQVELSVRRTGSELKWHELELAKKNETPIEVKVIEANTGGVIVEISETMRGFVPSSQLKNNRIYAPNMYSSKDDASKVLQTKLAEMIGEVLKVKVMEIDKEKNKVILSEKSVYSENDMQLRNQTLSSLKIGDNLEGTVTGIAPFGLFINAQGVEGLVHLSEISWDKVSTPADFYKVGDVVKVQVIGLQDNGKRIAYSIKRLLQDPWKNIVQKYKVGQIVEGEVKSIADYGAFIKIEDGLNGLIHISELSSKLVKNPSQVVQPGDKIKVMIISISNDDRHLGLSLKRAQKAANASEEAKTDDNGSRELEGLEKLIGEAK